MGGVFSTSGLRKVKILENLEKKKRSNFPSPIRVDGDRFYIDNILEVPKQRIDTCISLSDGIEETVPQSEAEQEQEVSLALKKSVHKHAIVD